jgi:predicted phage terminase large subunit-like protein
MEFTATVAAVEELTAWADECFPKLRGHLKLVEDKANGPAVISTLGRLIPGMHGVKPQGGKTARARAVAPQVEAGNVHLPGAPNADHTDSDPTVTPLWVRELVDECASFPNAAHDDQVDALSQALSRMTAATGRTRGARGPRRARVRSPSCAGRRSSSRARRRGPPSRSSWGAPRERGSSEHPARLEFRAPL